MKDRIFLDSNILLYALVDNTECVDKKQITIKLMDKLQADKDSEVIISTQVLGEIFNVLSKKYKTDKNIIISTLEVLAQNIVIKSVSENTIKKSWEICKMSNYSFYDCLIIASALENSCNKLYSEDLNDSHNIEKQLFVINPYK